MLWGWLDHSWRHNTSIIHYSTSPPPILTPIPTPTCQCWVPTGPWVLGWDHQWGLIRSRWVILLKEGRLAVQINHFYHSNNSNNNNLINKAKPNQHRPAQVSMGPLSHPNSNPHSIPFRPGPIMLNCCHLGLSNNSNNNKAVITTPHPTSPSTSNSPNTHPISHHVRAVHEASIRLGALGPLSASTQWVPESRPPTHHHHHLSSPPIQPITHHSPIPIASFHTRPITVRKVQLPLVLWCPLG